MAKIPTIFQRLNNVIAGTAKGVIPTKNITYTLNRDEGNVPLYTFKTKEERDQKLLQLKQQKLLAHQWAKASYDSSIQQTNDATLVRLMYMDADRMDMWPEIGSALDIYAEESCTVNKKGKMINVTSSSDRIVAILEDLFINRLDLHIMGEMVVRCMCKYGNEYMLLNIDKNNGVIGWRELPVHEMARIESGILSPNGTAVNASLENLKPGDVKFLWAGHNENMPYESWQVAHFRLIKDSMFLPYGCSILNKARRHWRILSMMEDAMLLYRLERSIERRIFKVNVGLIDEVDIPAFLQEFMNNVKRAPIIDPQTGMMDLRKNFLDVSADYVIPVRNNQDPTEITTLQSAQTPTSMDDINYIEKKILSALRIPKTFLNFEEAQGKGQNLSLVDIRFCRAINSVQKSFLMELNKIAIIHLYLLGFRDDLTNFSLSLNNPSNQIEQFELDNQQKRLANATTALSEQGGGIPLMSWRRVQKEIMGRTDDEISDMLNEIRLETAIAMELKLTSQIIKKTNTFKKVDNIYGEPGAEYDYSQVLGGGEPGGFGGGAPMPPMGGGFGDELGDLGEPGAEDMGELSGQEGSIPLEDMGGNPPLMESKNRLKNYFDEYSKLIAKKKDTLSESTSIFDKAFLINENINNTIAKLEKEDTPNIID